jgi:hypothetical protein
MKISQKQAGLLAREVLNQLKKQKIGEVPETIIGQLKKFKEKRQQLLDACKVSDDALREHESTLRKIVGTNGNDRINSYDSVPQMVDKLKERDFPKLSAIEDEIILGAMFSSDDDLQSFVNKIVKKFDKKTKSKVLQN